MARSCPVAVLAGLGMALASCSLAVEFDRSRLETDAMPAVPGPDAADANRLDDAAADALSPSDSPSTPALHADAGEPGEPGDASHF